MNWKSAWRAFRGKQAVLDFGSLPRPGLRVEIGTTIYRLVRLETNSSMSDFGHVVMTFIPHTEFEAKFRHDAR